MSDHPEHQMHSHSLLALGTLDVSRREQEVLAALASLGGVATDRQLARAMGTEDCNRARPRVTGLIDKGILREVGWQKDETTGKRVRLVEARP